MTKLLFLIAACCCLFSFRSISYDNAGPITDTLQQLSWLSGDWSKETKSGLYKETWGEAQDNRMEGQSIQIAGVDTISHSKLHLEHRIGDGFYYVKEPRSKAAILYKLVQVTDTRAVFENVELDPHRIIYQRTAKNAMLLRWEGSAEALYPIEMQLERAGQ